MASQLQEVHWSDLQTNPKGVAELADAGDVRVIRRDGVNLLLTREDRVASASAGAVTAARALRHIVEYLVEKKDPKEIGRLFAEEFPWLLQLPAEDMEKFADDFADAVLAAAELARWEVIEQVMVEWKATAVIYADPVLSRELSRPITDDLGPVPSPVGEE